MKRLLTIILIMFALSANAQTWPIDKETNLITFSEVVNVDSVSKSDLFLRANEWFANTFNDSKEVIRMSDKESGKIIGKGASRVSVKMMGIGGDAGVIYYDISIIAKNGRYKYEITNIYHDRLNTNIGGSGGPLENVKAACGSLSLPNGQFTQIKQQAFDNISLLVIDLKNFMSKTKDTIKDSW